MLKVSPPSLPPTGAITGMMSLRSSASSTIGLIAATSPTMPMSSSSPAAAPGPLMRILRARMSSPSLPDKPTACPPWRLIRLTISLLVFPTRTISTTSMVAGSVTRMPRTKRDGMPSCCNMAPICGPPPCTTTGFMPTNFSSTMSWAKLLFSASSTMAWPPYLTTIVLPAKRLM